MLTRRHWPLLTSRVANGGEFYDASVERSHGRSSNAQCKSQFGKLSNNADVLDQEVQWREKGGIHEMPDLNVSKGRIP